MSTFHALLQNPLHDPLAPFVVALYVLLILGPLRGTPLLFHHELVD